MTQSASPSTSHPLVGSAGQLVPGRLVREGAGVRNIVSVGGSELPQFDPFLLLAEFGGTDPADYRGGFPDHPHRGFETLTYVLEGRLKHADSRGAVGRLGPGDLQRMKAARGIVHAEMPDQTTGPLRAVQIWLNLPARHKMDEPSYQDLPSERVPVHLQTGASVRILVGSAFGYSSEIGGGPTDLVLLDIALAAGAEMSVPIHPGHAALTLMLDGRARLAGEIVGAGDAMVLSPTRKLSVSTDQTTRFLLLAARPIGEPVARAGPFVMNTGQEIEQAIADHRAGLFSM
jgi:quercetin 2,3-dioxygenase